MKSMRWVLLLSVGLITFSAIAADLYLAAAPAGGLAERVRADLLVRVPFITSAIALVVAVAMSTLAFHWRVSRPPAATDPPVAAGHDELAELGRALHGLAGNLEGALQALKAERERMERAAQQMREELLLLERGGPWRGRTPGSGWRS